MSVRDVLDWLEETGSQETVDGMTRYGIPNDRAFGVPMGEMKQYAKRIGPDHALALALWDEGWYESRTIAVFVAKPAELTREQADGWVADMDSWAIVDTACFHLLDRTPFAWDAVRDWAASGEEFVRRAGFALLWALALHDRQAPDDRFLACLPIAERLATDERTFVKKSIDMALRAVGKRNATLRAAVLATAGRLAESDDRTAAWIGRHVRKELS